MDDTNHDTSIPGGSLVAGIGFVCGVRCMVLATDSGIDAGAMTEAGNMKLMRCQEIALENRLPFIHLVESLRQPAQVPRRQVHPRRQHLLQPGTLSAAGLPVITVVHGSSTAGGAICRACRITW